MVIIIMVLVSIGVGWLDYYWSNFVVLISVCYYHALSTCQLVITFCAVVSCNRDPKPNCTASLQHKRHT